MGFVWRKQPFQTIKELHDHYLTFTMVTTRREAMELAAEAKQWMRDNAPWKDRPEFRQGANGQMIQVRSDYEISEGHAREGLTAFVVGGRTEQARARRELLEAAARDVDLLKDINRQRRDRLFAINKGIDKAVAMGRITGPQDLSFPARMQMAKLGKSRTSVPKSQSNVTAVERLQAQRYPLVEIKFQGNKRLRYMIWLELGMGGRYSIIGPALDYWGPKMMARVQRIANLKQYQGTINFGEVLTQEQQLMESVREFDVVYGEDGRTYREHTAEFQAQSRVRSSRRQRSKKASGDSRRKYSKGRR